MPTTMDTVVGTVKVTAAVLLSIATVRYAWKRIVADSQSVKSAPAKEEAKNKDAKADGEDGDDHVWIYFGSQSGTAEGFSKELEEEMAEHELKATVVDLEEFDPEEFARHKIVILVVATYGEGDPTDNAVEYFKWLKDDGVDESTLKGMRFTVMGLGNRQYVNFNSCGKMAEEQMQRLGADLIYERGEGDDDQNIEEDFEQWKENGLWEALKKAAGKEAGVKREVSGANVLGKEETLASLTLRAELREDARKLPVDPLVQVGGSDILGKWYFQAHEAKVVAERELRQVSDFQLGKSTKHLDIDVKGIPAVDWRTADNLEVLPRNPEDVVAWFAKRLGAEGDLDSSLTFARAPGVERPVKKPFPTPCTVRDALSLYCDLLAPPGKPALKKLTSFVRSSEDRAALTALVDDRPTYQWLTGEKVRLTFRELFELYFASAEIDIGTFLQLCPRQKSRPYTIASSYREDKHKIGICVSVVAEELKSLNDVVVELGKRGHRVPGAAAALAAQRTDTRSFRGVCSSMLCGHTSVGDRLWIVSRASTFRLPRKSTTPIVMIGAGTGIAPFRGFVREFVAEAGIRKRTKLFFGCTKSDTDYLYKDELSEALSTEPAALGELVTAFSREQQQKVYVQHRLRERADEVAKLVKDGAYIYVCGATAMGASIRDELAKALGSADYVNRLQTEGRFVEELW